MDKKNSYQHPRAPICMLIYSFLEYFAPLAGMVVLVAMGGYYDKRTILDWAKPVAICSWERPNVVNKAIAAQKL